MKNLVALAVSLGVISQVQANTLVKQIIIERTEASDNFYYNHPEARPKSVRNEQVTKCINNVASAGGEDFPCDNVDFYSFVAFEELEITNRPHRNRASMADIWGWYSEATKREITIAGMDNGVSAVDSTDPLNPCVLAKFPSSLRDDIWDDVKVMNDVLFHVKDSREADNNITKNFGIEVYDLTQLDSLDCHEVGYEIPDIHPDHITSDFGRAHNVVVNPITERVYAVGSQICAGGLAVYDGSGKHKIALRFLGCADADGYTHDAQCTIYTGPDTRHTDKEICFAFNEDTLTIWDVTNFEEDGAIMLARQPYNNSAYSHQGWVTRDMTKVLLDDELDELCNDDLGYSRRCNITGFNLDGTLTTTTNIFDISDLENPRKEGIFSHNDPSIDHNLYIWGNVHEQGLGGNKALKSIPDPNYAYLHNYEAGLKIIDMHNEDFNEWDIAGYFDFTPEETRLEFFGAWSGYMHPSGVYAVNVIERGMFLIQPNMAYTEEFPAAPIADDNDGPSDGSDDGEEVTENEAILLAVIGILTLVILALMLVLFFNKSQGAAVNEKKEKVVEVKV